MRNERGVLGIADECVAGMNRICVETGDQLYVEDDVCLKVATSQAPRNLADHMNCTQ